MYTLHQETLSVALSFSLPAFCSHAQWFYTCMNKYTHKQQFTLHKNNSILTIKLKYK